MEFFLNLIFYDIKWTYIISYIPLNLYKIFYYLSFLLNLLQTILILQYSTQYQLNNTIVNYLIILLINLFLILQMIRKIDNIIVKDFNFLIEVIKINPQISFKPFEIIIRSKAFESVVGILNISFSFYKMIITLYSADFIYDIESLFNGFFKVLYFALFEMYYMINLFVFIFFLISFFIILVIKVGFVILSLKNIVLQTKIMEKNRKKNSIDNADKKSTSEFSSLIHKIYNQNESIKSSSQKNIGKDD